MKPESREIIIPTRTANVAAFVLFIATAFAGGALFCYIWNFSLLITSFRSFLTEYTVLLASLVAGMVLHEAFHAIAWALSCRRGFRSIRFGFSIRQFSPYVHCSEFLKKGAFTFGVIAPLVLTGIVPLVYGIVTGAGWWFWFGAFFTAGAGGDLVTYRHIRPLRSNVLIRDHPDHLGFIVQENSDEQEDQKIASPNL